MDIKKIKFDDFVNKVNDASQKNKHKFSVSGYVGKSPTANHIRIYADHSLNDYIEVSAADVIHQEALSAHNHSGGGSILWIKGDAHVSHGSDSYHYDPKNNYFKGDIADALVKPTVTLRTYCCVDGGLPTKTIASMCCPAPPTSNLRSYCCDDGGLPTKTIASMCCPAAPPTSNLRSYCCEVDGGLPTKTIASMCCPAAPPTSNLRSYCCDDGGLPTKTLASYCCPGGKPTLTVASRCCDGGIPTKTIASMCCPGGSAPTYHATHYCGTGNYNPYDGY